MIESRIIKGEPILETATLTACREMHFTEKDPAHSFVEEECKHAFKKGEQKGEKVGYERALNESKELFALLQALTNKILEHNKRLLEQLKPEVVEFSIALCERVIHKELNQPEVMVNLINSLLNISASSLRNAALNIILAPDDLIMLENHLVKIQYNKREIQGVSFHADPLMRRGSCRIETPSGLLNYTISRELADLQAKILHE